MYNGTYFKFSNEIVNIVIIDVVPKHWRSMNRKVKCCLCRTSEEDLYNLGELKKLRNFAVHYYCLLLSNTVTQSGADDEGILGFLESDIKSEVNRSNNRLCTYCGKNGAHICCSTRGCDIRFHLPCGLANGSGHQFHGTFPSNCYKHRPRQKLIHSQGTFSCAICYDNINSEKWMENLWSPCCKKHVFHKICLQRMALSAGYFFKCPICNNKDLFQKCMRRYGVFVPDQDASWELEPHAFEELLHRHDSCDAKVCSCPKGRKYDGSGKFKLILCETCGSQGTHIGCSNLKKTNSWSCPDCDVRPMIKNSMNSMVLHKIKIGEPGCSTWNESSNLLHSGSSQTIIEISSDEDEILVVDDALDTNCLNANNNVEDVSLISVDHNECARLGFVISNVRSLNSSRSDSRHNDNFGCRNEPDLALRIRGRRRRSARLHSSPLVVRCVK